MKGTDDICKLNYTAFMEWLPIVAKNASIFLCYASSILKRTDLFSMVHHIIITNFPLIKNHEWNINLNQGMNFEYISFSFLKLNVQLIFVWPGSRTFFWYIYCEFIIAVLMPVTHNRHSIKVCKHKWMEKNSLSLSCLVLLSYLTPRISSNIYIHNLPLTISRLPGFFINITSPSSRRHVTRGLGFPVARHVNAASSPSCTAISADDSSLMISGGTIKI